MQLHARELSAVEARASAEVLQAANATVQAQLGAAHKELEERVAELTAQVGHVLWTIYAGGLEGSPEKGALWKCIEHQVQCGTRPAPGCAGAIDRMNGCGAVCAFVAVPFGLAGCLRPVASAT